uniref:MORN repeat-containing protein 3 n=1 Tax=Sphaeramia orbicularis TaxID=375764 RepID=A0A673AGK3_9TELE
MQSVTSELKNLHLPALWDKKAQKCGLRHTVFSANGDKYTGEWKDNLKHGKGTQVWKRTGSIYSGDWKCGKRDGLGSYSILLPETKQYEKKYCGQWKHGQKHGQGKYFYRDSSVYEGDWSEGRRSGWGRMYYANGDFYEGQWLKDQKHGQGMIQYANGNWYEGSWKDGKKNGNGKFYYLDTGQLYEGYWVNGTAKCGTLSDCGRDHAPRPTKYSLPQVRHLYFNSIWYLVSVWHLFLFLICQY